MTKLHTTLYDLLYPDGHLQCEEAIQKRKYPLEDIAQFVQENGCYRDAKHLGLVWDSGEHLLSMLGEIHKHEDQEELSDGYLHPNDYPFFLEHSEKLLRGYGFLKLHKIGKAAKSVNLNDPRSRRTGEKIIRLLLNEAGYTDDIYGSIKSGSYTKMLDSISVKYTKGIAIKKTDTISGFFSAYWINSDKK